MTLQKTPSHPEAPGPGTTELNRGGKSNWYTTLLLGKAMKAPPPAHQSSSLPSAPLLGHLGALGEKTEHVVVAMLSFRTQQAGLRLLGAQSGEDLTSSSSPPSWQPAPNSHRTSDHFCLSLKICFLILGINQEALDAKEEAGVLGGADSGGFGGPSCIRCG